MFPSVIRSSRDLEQALNKVTIHGHRGHVENEFSTMKDWKR